MVISDTVIHGSTRLQKYGFLLYKQYGKELSRIADKTARGNTSELRFYDDWEPLWYGPFSRGLKEDTGACVSAGLVHMAPANQELKSHRYALTIRGRVRWRRILHECPKEIEAVHEKIANLQATRLERLLEGIYHAYPEYTKHSTICERFSQPA